VEPDVLKKLGVLGVLVDLDNTLGKPYPKEPTPKAKGWLTGLRKSGIPAVVVSNARSHKRVRDFCEPLELPYIARARKPRIKALLKAAAILKLPPERLAMIGDQVFTDVRGAKRAGMYAIWVRPLVLSNPLHWLRHQCEKPFLRKVARI
jgi:hypothetical protein